MNKPGYNTGGWIGNYAPSTTTRKPSTSVTGNLLGSAIKQGLSTALKKKKKNSNFSSAFKKF